MVKLNGKIAQCSTKAKLQKGFRIHVYRIGIENHDESIYIILNHRETQRASIFDVAKYP